MNQVFKSFCLHNRLTQESPDDNFKGAKKIFVKNYFIYL